MSFQPAQPPTPPSPPNAPVAISAGDLAQSTSSPAELLLAAKASRSELRNQLDRLEGQRRDISQQLSDGETAADAKPGLQARLKDLDARIASTDQQIAQADAAVAKASAVPGAVVPDRPAERNRGDDAMIPISIVFTLFVLCPIAIAFARRLWKRGSAVVAPIPREMTDRLELLTQSVESIALEVERIGEGQRFITKVMGEGGKALGSGAAQPLAVGQGEKVAVPRQS